MVRLHLHSCLSSFLYLSRSLFPPLGCGLIRNCVAQNRQSITLPNLSTHTHTHTQSLRNSACSSLVIYNLLFCKLYICSTPLHTLLISPSSPAPPCFFYFCPLSVSLPLLARPLILQSTSHHCTPTVMQCHNSAEIGSSVLSVISKPV